MGRTRPAGEETGAGTRQRLLDAAFEVFSEEGYTGARVQEIARRAGLTTGAIYSNFDGKASLLGATIAARGLASVRGVLEPPAGDDAGRQGSMIQRLGVLLLAGHQRPVDPLLVEAVAAAAHDPEVATMVRAQIASMGERLTTEIEAARAEGWVDDEITTESLVALCEAVVLGSHVLRALDVPRPERQAADTMFRRLLTAFRPRPRPRPRHRQGPAGEG